MSVDLDSIRQERQKWLGYKNISNEVKQLKMLKDDEFEVKLGSIVKIKSKKNADGVLIKNLAIGLKPWRKGPFKIDDLLIDSEWQSNIKFDIISKHFDITNKKVADIGCNNGYYMFRMMEYNPHSIVGFDPSSRYKTQFDFINHFVKSDIKYELLGIEHIQFYEYQFDVIFCLGVLYHRNNPIDTLKSLRKSLSKRGEVILDTFIIEGKEDYVLSPKNTYMKIPNIAFVPTLSALQNWCKKARFNHIDVLEIKEACNKEQRKTDWTDTQSLEDFVDFDKGTTYEGYPIPKRVYLRLKV